MRAAVPEQLATSKAQRWDPAEATRALLAEELAGRHRDDDTTSRAIRKILRADVIVTDDIGLLLVSAETAEALYRVVEAAYEKRSIALSSNLHPAGFDDLMPKTIASATVDRRLHHAHIVLTTGKGVTPPGQLNPRAEHLATPGQFCWPRPGRSPVRQRADLTGP